MTRPATSLSHLHQSVEMWHACVPVPPLQPVPTARVILIPTPAFGELPLLAFCTMCYWSLVVFEYIRTLYLLNCQSDTVMSASVSLGRVGSVVSGWVDANCD